MGETTAARLLCEFKLLNNLVVLEVDVDLNRSSRVWLLCMDARQDQALIKTAENCGNKAV